MKEKEERLKENAEAEEDEMLSEKYGHRAELPEDQWLTKPPDMSLIEWFYSSHPEYKTKI